jgi:hypothetical protein
MTLFPIQNHPLSRRYAKTNCRLGIQELLSSLRHSGKTGVVRRPTLCPSHFLLAAIGALGKLIVVTREVTFPRNDSRTAQFSELETEGNRYMTLIATVTNDPTFGVMAARLCTEHVNINLFFCWNKLHTIKTCRGRGGGPRMRNLGTWRSWVVVSTLLTMYPRR